MKTDSLLRIATVIFACLTVILGLVVITDRMNEPEPAAVAAGMGDDDHAEGEEHADEIVSDDAGMGEDDHPEGEAHTDEPDITSDDTGTAADAAADAGMGDDNHEHAEGVEVSEWEAIPSISLDVIEDGHGGYVALASISNFTFMPENVDTPAAVGEGHGHIYVNGEKISRIYDNSYWIGELEPGEYTISVTLNANDHQELTLNGEVLSAEYNLTVEE